MSTQPLPVAIVGGGIAGLTCARYLHRAGVPARVFEKADRVGGRVATDTVEGFRLDRGFQVFLTAYPEARALLDYDALDLKPFYRGARVRLGGQFHLVGDPRQHPLSALPAAFSPVGTLPDKLRVARLVGRLKADSLDALFARPEMTTREVLGSRWGFSDSIVETFFRPFFGGITLDPALRASSRTFEFVMKMFAEGETVLPARGMAAIPEQLAAGLPDGTVTLDAEVRQVRPDGIVLEGGRQVAASAVVLATEAPEAAALWPTGAEHTLSVGEVCLYFAAPTAPFAEPLLVLDGDGKGPVNNLTVVSNVAPGYAPEGQALVSAVVLGNPLDTDAAIEAAARVQLAGWFGPGVQHWRHLRTYRILYGLPDQAPPFVESPPAPVKLADGLFRCGDHLATASLNGAMATGRRAAEAICAARA